MNTHNQPMTETENRIDDIMIVEYNLIESVRENLSTEGESRGNFFLAIVSACLIAIGALAQSNSLPSTDIAATACAIGVVLVLIGISTFYYSVRRNYREIFYARCLNSIRHYFVKLEPCIQDHFKLGTKDDYPPYTIQLGDQAQLIAVINSALLGALVAGIDKNVNSYSELTIPVFVGVLAFWGSSIWHYLFIRSYARKFDQPPGVISSSQNAMKAVSKSSIAPRRTTK